MAITLLLHGAPHGAGVIYQPLGPWIVPWRFGSFEAEYQALRAGAGLIDYSTQALLEVRGANRVDFLHRILTNDIKRLAPGRGCRAALLTPAGRLTAELLVLMDPDACWLLCDLDRAEAVAGALIRYVFNEDVLIKNRERAMAALAVQGPRTPDILARLFPAQPIPQEAADHALVRFLDIPVRLIRHPVAAGSGLLCLVPAAEALAAWRALRDAGLTPVGWEALNTARIESGIPWFGFDMDASSLLPETGLDTAVASDAKGCYVGQEIIARLATYGSVSRKLMGLRIDGGTVPAAGSRIRIGAAEAGQITSACRSPALRQPIALGYLKRGAYEPGTRVQIDCGAERMTATVSARPLVAPA